MTFSTPSEIVLFIDLLCLSVCLSVSLSLTHTHSARGEREREREREREWGEGGDHLMTRERNRVEKRERDNIAEINESSR